MLRSSVGCSASVPSINHFCFCIHIAHHHIHVIRDLALLVASKKSCTVERGPPTRRHRRSCVASARVCICCQVGGGKSVNTLKKLKKLRQKLDLSRVSVTSSAALIVGRVPRVVEVTGSSFYVTLVVCHPGLFCSISLLLHYVSVYCTLLAGIPRLRFFFLFVYLLSFRSERRCYLPWHASSVSLAAVFSHPPVNE